MGKVVTELSMSLDGFVTGPHDGPDSPLGEGGEALFTWFNSGDTLLTLPGTDMVFRVSKESADYLQPQWNNGGAMITGRRMYAIANEWGGKPPTSGRCFVVTHKPDEKWDYEGSPFTFVTDGIESAVRQAKDAAGDKDIAVSSANIAQQCIRAGLLDEIHVNLVPVLLGGGVRLLDNLGDVQIKLETIDVIVAPGVTHLAFCIKK